MILYILYHLRPYNASNPNYEKTGTTHSNTNNSNQYHEANNNTRCKGNYQKNFCTGSEQCSISKNFCNLKKIEPGEVMINAFNQECTSNGRKWVDIRKLNDKNRINNTRIKFHVLKIKNIYKKSIRKNSIDTNQSNIINKIFNAKNKIKLHKLDIMKELSFCANNSIYDEYLKVDSKNIKKEPQLTHESLKYKLNMPPFSPNKINCDDGMPINDAREFVTTSDLQGRLNQPCKNTKNEKEKAIDKYTDAVVNIIKNVDLFNNKIQSPSQINKLKKAVWSPDLINKCHENVTCDKNNIMNSNFIHQENNFINALCNKASNKNSHNCQFYHITARSFDFNSKINISINIVKRIDLTLSLDNFLLLQFLNTYTEIQEYVEKSEVAHTFNGTNSYIKMYNANFVEYINCFTTLDLYNAGIYLYYVNISMQQYTNKIIYKIPLCSQNNIYANPIDNEDCMIISYIQKFVAGNFLEAEFNMNNLNMLVVKYLYKPDAFVRKNIDFIFLREIVLQILKKSTLETLTFFLELPSIIKHIETYKMKFNYHLYINYYVYTAFVNILNGLVKLKWNHKENNFAFYTDFFDCFDYIKIFAKHDKQKINFYMILLCVIRPFVSPSKYKQICQKIILQGIFYYDSKKIKCNNFKQLESYKRRFFLFQLLDISIFLENQSVFFRCRNDDSNIIEFILLNYRSFKVKFLFQRKKTLTYVINNLILFCRYLELYIKQEHDNIFKKTLIDPLMKILLYFHETNLKHSAKAFLFSPKDKLDKVNHVRLKSLDKIIDDISLIFIKHFASFNTN